MKLSKSTIAATFAALLIGGLSISPASAAPHQTGRVYTGSHAGFEIKGDSTNNNGRTAAEGTQPILKSNQRPRQNQRSWRIISKPCEEAVAQPNCSMVTLHFFLL